MNIDQLLGGRIPTLDEYAEFCGACEHLGREHLWTMITEYPQMHFLLRNAATDHLRQKIHEANMARFNKSTVDAFTQRLQDLGHNKK